MGTQIADLYARIRGDWSELKGGLDNAKKEIGKFGSALSGMGLGGAAAFLTIGGAVAGVQKLVSASLKQTAQYSNQIRELSRNTGMTVKESAQLINVADDMQVSFGDLTAAMRISIQKGMLPTIDNLAMMSDAYIALQDPLLRSQFLIETFGRNGLEMSKIMEIGSSGIKQIANETENFGLIMNQTAIQTMRQFELATNNLGDSFNGLKQQIALNAAPAITEASNGLAEYNKNTIKALKGAKFLGDAVRAGAISQGEANILTWELAFNLKSAANAQGFMTDRLRENNLVLDAEGNIVSNVAAMYQEYAKARMAATLTPTAPQAVEPGQSPFGIKSMAGDIRTGFQQLKLGQAGYAVIQDVATNIQVAVEKHAITPEQGQAFFKNLSLHEAKMRVEAGENMGQVAKEYADAWGGSAEKAKKEIKSVGDSVTALNGLASDIYIYVHTIEVGGGVARGGLGLNAAELAASRARGSRKPASGLTNFIVPSGYNSFSSGMPMMVHSGERVSVSPASRTQVDNDAMLLELQGLRKEFSGFKRAVRDAVLQAV